MHAIVKVDAKSVPRVCGGDPNQVKRFKAPEDVFPVYAGVILAG